MWNFLRYIPGIVLAGLTMGSLATTAMADGRALGFLIEEGAAKHQQTAFVQGGRVLVSKAGGDPASDLLFDAKTNTLYFINHQTRSYHLIDESVVNKANSMLESITDVAETQQGVLADLLETIGISDDEDESTITIQKTDTWLSAADINCQLFQQFRDQQLETEMCIAGASSLTALGNHYETMEKFYDFGDLLLSRAGAILNNMGMSVPQFKKLGKGGLPVMAYVTRSKTKLSLTGIDEQSWPWTTFAVPEGYTREPIPFIG